MAARHKTARALCAAIATLALAGSARAARVDAPRAARAVGDWVARSTAPSRAPTGAVRTFSSGGTNLFHLVGLERGGFAAVAAGDDAAPVLGFTTHGSLPDADDGSPLWDMIASMTQGGRDEARPSRRGKVGGYAARPRFDVAAESVSVARRKSASASQSYEDENYLDDVRVSPLLKSTWDQGNVAGAPCYNYYTPGNYLCGCVATALAQVMRHNKWPAASVPQITRECAIGPEDSSVLTNMTTQGGVFDWDDMPLVPAAESSLSVSQRQAIGKLCSDVGISVGMVYDSGGSYAWGELAHGSLTNVFGYASAHILFDDEDFGLLPVEDLQKALLTNLDAGYPCPLGVWNHEVVGDGYGFKDGDLYCHMELGWSGDCDFWYLEPAYYGTTRTYSVIYNVFPDFDAQLVTGRVLDGDGNPVAGAEVCGTLSGAADGSSQGVSGSSALYATTGTSGTYAFRIPVENAGRTLTLEASRGGRVSGRRSVEITPCESVVVTNFMVEADYLEEMIEGCYGRNVCANSWGNDLYLSFAAGESIAFADGSVALTSGEAAWLSGLGPRDEVTNALVRVRAQERNVARLLNLDVTAEGWRDWSFGCESLDVAREGDETVVAIAVRLDRGGRAAPIYGALRLYSVDLATGAEERLGEVAVDGGSFATGETATMSFRAGGAALAVKAVVE